MTKTKRAVATPIEQPFHKHFVAIYGEERWWKALYPALAESTRYAAVVNRYATTSDTWKATHGPPLPPNTEGDDSGALKNNTAFHAMTFPSLSDAADPEHYLQCFTRPLAPSGLSNEATVSVSTSTDFPQPTVVSSLNGRLISHWNLDGASALVAHLLDVRSGDSVLDLCAAPGGKSITLAQNIWPSLHIDTSITSAARPGRLVSNEVDGRRHKRLAENLKAYLPADLLKTGRITTTSIDATQSGPALNALMSGGDFDKVLVDAPCSSERHIIHTSAKTASGKMASEMSSWRTGTSKRLATTQADLLMTALRAVKVGGQVMYATCSLEPMENDSVVEKMLQLVEKEDVGRADEIWMDRVAGSAWWWTMGSAVLLSDDEVAKNLTMDQGDME
ncbi:hypothetical protein LTR78_002923 [Recurvomyces mirabilis]|uniref:NOL1/NOP2/Sun domain family member 4 n=1 Tax=Recurvomyces mirabilis TaxID=574656 RepID=A0AAE0WSR2_9PEZI|nr:hypothetical protein LTR78_002923 [Recurvomyces mirabilis]KAK5159343.1 hypothetical protein LTS14_002485 [Recurvomyces mirabilis]